MAQSDDSHNGLEGTWRCRTHGPQLSDGRGAEEASRQCLHSPKGVRLPTRLQASFLSLSTPGLGTWQHTGGHTYSAVSDVFIFSPAGVWIQVHRLTRIIVLGSDANTYTDTVALEIFDTNGNLIVTGCGTTAASRLN